jgi:hypothetical protein
MQQILSISNIFKIKTLFLKTCHTQMQFLFPLIALTSNEPQTFLGYKSGNFRVKAIWDAKGWFFMMFLTLMPDGGVHTDVSAEGVLISPAPYLYWGVVSMPPSEASS